MLKRRNFLKGLLGLLPLALLPTVVIGKEKDRLGVAILVSATVDGCGIVYSQLFTTWDDADEFTKNELDKTLRYKYSDKMADDESLIVSTGAITVPRTTYLQCGQNVKT